jgi:ribosomal protein L19E
MNIEKIKNEIKKFHEEGKTKGAIEGYLKFTYDFSTKDAKNLVSEVVGKTTNNNKTSWEETIRFIRKNYGKMEKKQLIEEMMKIKGGSYSSMNHAYNYIKFAMEFAKQEVEDYKKKNNIK